jgi:hypothetical protein
MIINLSGSAKVVVGFWAGVTLRLFKVQRILKTTYTAVAGIDYVEDLAPVADCYGAVELHGAGSEATK